MVTDKSPCVQILTLPTVLTLGRVAAIPALVGAWFSHQWLACTALFVSAALTDYLDGYLARKMVRRCRRQLPLSNDGPGTASCDKLNFC